jgi:hypothetical protein
MYDISPPYKLGKVQNVSYTGTAGTISDAISAGVQIVRVVCSTAAYISFGASPTATTSDYLMGTGIAEYFIVPTGGATKVSAVQVASGGVLSVTECSR